MVEENECWRGMPVRLLGILGRSARRSKNHRGHKHVIGVVTGGFWGENDDMVSITVPGRRLPMWVCPDEIVRVRR